LISLSKGITLPKEEEKRTCFTYLFSWISGFDAGSPCGLGRDSFISRTILYNKIVSGSILFHEYGVKEEGEEDLIFRKFGSVAKISLYNL
jgi:hypothetical protein